MAKKNWAARLVQELFVAQDIIKVKFIVLLN